MKIKTIETTNFMGLAGNHVVEMPQVGCLVGKNGIGKTSILSAIRYGLTGDRPEGDIIHKAFTEVKVSVTLEVDGVEHTFTREESREKASSFRIDGKRSTLKAMNEFIAEFIGIPVEKIKILSSADIVAKMKPQEFGNFIMEYVAKTTPRKEVLKLVPEMTKGMEDILLGYLSEDVTIEELDNLLSVCVDERKFLKRNIRGLEATLSTMITSKPTSVLEDIEQEIRDIESVENTIRMYQVEMDTYKKQREERHKMVETEARVKKSIEDMKDILRPDMFVKEELQKQVASLQESRGKLKSTYSGLQQSTEELKKILAALESSVCPISPLITCHENKSVAKDEIGESIQVNIQGMEDLNTEIKKIEMQMEEVDGKLEAFNKNVSAYNQKCMLMKQLNDIKEMSKTEIKEPKKPSVPKKEDIEKRLFQLNNTKKRIIEWDERMKLETNLNKQKEKLMDYEKLCKVLSDKGVVRTTILKSYIGILEDACNEVVEMIRPELHFSFVAEDGITVLMDAGNGIDLPFQSLSGGEKAYYLYVILDMLNKLVGTDVIFMDELSVVDDECFDTLLDIVTENKDNYDHIIIAAVDHQDTIKSLNTHKEIQQISISLAKDVATKVS